MLPVFLLPSPSPQGSGPTDERLKEEWARLHRCVWKLLWWLPKQAQKQPDLREPQVRIQTSSQDKAPKLLMPPSENPKCCLIPFPGKEICSVIKEGGLGVWEGPRSPCQRRAGLDGSEQTLHS